MFVELVFTKFHQEILLSQLLQYYSHMLNMFLIGSREYEYIVQVSKGEHIEIFSDHVVDQFLKGSQCISQAKQHDLVFVVPKPSSKGHFPFFTFLYTYSIVSVPNVDRYELFGTQKSVL